MKTFKIVGIIAIILFALVCSGCEGEYANSSDQKQNQQQELLAGQAYQVVGMPNIVNFHEKKTLKSIMEMCDNPKLITYLYMENMIPAVVKGHTCYGGKLTYMGRAIGYPIPYASQFTAPTKLVRMYAGGEWYAVPQCDPPGIFKPDSAAATWILRIDEKTNEVAPDYIESNVTVSQFKKPLD